MKSVKQLTEERGSLVEQMNNIVDIAKTEKRELSGEEATKFDGLSSDVETFDASIKRAHKVEQMKAASVKNAVESKEENSVKREWSLFKAIDGMLNGNITGLEAEMQQEALKENRNLSGIGIPTFMLEKRAYIDQGGSAIAPSSVEAYVDALRVGTIYDRVGVNNLGNLQANSIVPVTGLIESEWAAENGNGDDQSADFGKITLTPKRVNAYSNISRMLLAQNPGAEAAVMRELGRAVGTSIDTNMFASTDESAGPACIAGTSGVLTFTEAASANLASDLVEAEQTLANGSGLVGTEKYVLNWNLLTAAKTGAQVSSVSPLYYRDNGVDYVNGHPVFFTDKTASVTGTSGDGLFGDFGKVYFASFGPLDILVDPYTAATNNAVRLVLNHHYDFALAQGAAFTKFTSLV